MTRFARAKGSKSSNEKNPEDSTPWEVMKEQLLQAKKEKDESKNRKEAEKERIKNYENFLKEQKIQKRKATWCDFSETEDNTQSINVPLKKRKKHKKQKTDDNTETQITKETNKAVIPEDVISNTAKQSQKKKAKGKFIETQQQPEKRKHKQTGDNTVIQSTEETDKDVVIENENLHGMKQSHKKKKKNKLTQKQHEGNTTNDVDTVEVNEINLSKSVEKPNKKKKRKNKHIDNQSNETPKTLSQISSNVSKSNEDIDNYNNSHHKTVQSVKKKKGKKRVNGKGAERGKDVNDRSFHLIINGKQIELVKVDGFPVMKKDAERLQELKASMMQKGIPKSEIQRTLKLERRRAEKALARIKRDVCYNCRKGGHNLSDCPELKSKIPGAEVGEGICFKCGSTEHRQFECKVQRDKEFRFATCFICKEPGHIARQCPDNPKGLYPNGGCCKLCGDVTHLRKDCPTVTEKKVEKSIKLSTFGGSRDVEGIDPLPEAATSEETSKKAKKIKF